MGFFDILCLGINGIVGSGIFLLPGRLLGGLGPLSILQFVICGALLVIVALCYAEASSRVDRNGGPYNYVRIAFGSRLGFAMGWLLVVSMMFNYATVLTGLVGYAGTLVPWLADEWHAKAVYALVIGFLTLLNIRGVRMGADAVNVLTVAKVIPLLIFIAFGLFAIEPAHFVPFAPHGFAPMAALILATNFTYQGFEVAPVPAGEVENARRVVPRAMVGALLFSMLLYVIIQTIIVGTGAPIADSEGPLADAARVFMGPWGGMMITIGAIVSMSGYVSGSALLSPRSLEILCEDGYLPKAGARYHAKYNTPHIAILFTGLVSFVMACCLNFDRLIDISAFVVVIQYAATCLSVPILRRRIPDTAVTYRVPGGWLLPLAGVAVSILFASQIKTPELIWTTTAVVVGLLVSYAYRHFGRKAV
ncbi:MAG: APC family permease [Sideroxyarcus sp.]|nr:APC family permease [Sideroxyarcus sp.]